MLGGVKYVWNVSGVDVGAGFTHGLKVLFVNYGCMVIWCGSVSSVALPMKNVLLLLGIHFMGFEIKHS